MDISANLEPVALGNQLVDAQTYAKPEVYHGLMTRIRREQPVCLAAPDGYDPFWVVSKHADLKAVEMKAKRFVNAPRMVLRSQAMNEQIKALTGGRPFLFNNIAQMDGAEHAALRKLTHEWFLPESLRRLEPEIRAIARDYIDRMVDYGGKCDFMRDVASWYPLRVIMRILGVPIEDEPKMLLLTQQLFGVDDPDIKGDVKLDLVGTVKEFFAYFTELTADRRRRPTDDVASVIANARINNEPIGDLEAISYYVLIATAGHDTTSSTTAGGLLALLQNPDEMKALRTDPSLLPSAIEEMLRWVTPVAHFFRTATEDATVGNVHVRAGESLMMAYPSANRDEDVFEDPFSFSVRRNPNKHLAFGFGPHSCLGQFLARLEIRCFYEELLERVGDIELAGPPAWLQSNFIPGLKYLPVTFTAKA